MAALFRAKGKGRRMWRRQKFKGCPLPTQAQWLATVFHIMINHNIIMKTPERSRTSCVRHFLVLSPQNLFSDIMWWHNVTSHVITSLACHSDGTRHLSIVLVLNYYAMHEISPGDLHLWPKTLRYKPSLAKVKVNFNTKNQGHRSNGSAVRVLTHRQTDTHRNMAPILWSRPGGKKKVWK